MPLYFNYPCVIPDTYCFTSLIMVMKPLAVAEYLNKNDGLLTVLMWYL